MSTDLARLWAGWANAVFHVLLLVVVLLLRRQQRATMGRLSVLEQEIFPAAPAVDVATTLTVTAPPVGKPLQTIGERSARAIALAAEARAHAKPRRKTPPGWPSHGPDPAA